MNTLLKSLIEGSKIFAIIVIIWAVALTPLLSICYYQSCKEAKILNKEFNTSYTCGDMFWTGDTIKEVVNGNKYRIETERK